MKCPMVVKKIELKSVPVQIRELDPSVREIRELNDQIGRISLSDQNAPGNTAAPKSKRRRKSKQALAETSAAGEKRKSKVVVDDGPAKPAEFQRELFDLNEYPPEDEADTVHDKPAPENPEAPEPSGVKKQQKGKKAVVYQNSSDSDDDSSRTISDLSAESMSLTHRRCEEVVDKGTKTKSILKKRSQISSPNDVTDDITRIPLPKRRKVAFNLDDDYENSNKNKKNKKRTAHEANEVPKLNEAEPSNRKGSNAPCGSKTAVRRVRSSKPPKHGPERLKRSHNEMVKEVTCTGVGQCDAVGGCEPSGSDSVVARAGNVNGSGEIVPAREECKENWNPAELSQKTAETFFQY